MIVVLESEQVGYIEDEKVNIREFNMVIFSILEKIL